MAALIKCYLALHLPTFLKDELSTGNVFVAVGWVWLSSLNVLYCVCFEVNLHCLSVWRVYFVDF